jgi:hypothetical protein
MRITTLTLCGLLLIGALASLQEPAQGQEPGPRRYYPLNTPLPPPGRAGMWANRIGKGSPVKFQQVQIQLPAAGLVTWYEGQPAREIAMPAPSMAGLLVGPVYRVKLSDMTDLPGVELFPSIELVDCLHPPVGRETQFPVIVPFTDEEILAAKQGSLVVKVIYLEQPNRAALVTAERGKAIPAIHVGPRDNPLEVADVHGRPLAIVRLGGRVPDANRPEPGFFGAGAPLHVSNVQPPAPAEEVIAVPKPKRKPAPKPAPEKMIEAAEPEPEAPQPEATQPEAKPAPAPEPAVEKSEAPETPEAKPATADEKKVEVQEEPKAESSPDLGPKASDFE